jgi:hypothetical protein
VSISFPSVGKNLENVWKKCFLLQNEFFLKKVAKKLAYVKKKQYLCSGFENEDPSAYDMKRLSGRFFCN